MLRAASLKLINRAAWDLLDACPDDGLGWVRQALRDELAAPERHIGLDVFGLCCERRCALRLRDFICATPSPRWVGN